MAETEREFNNPTPDPPEKEVQRLVEAAVGGNVEAFGELYKRYFDAVYRYIFFRLRSVQDAEDLTGQVFLNAWRAIERFQVGQVPFNAWLYTIAHNLLANHYRNRQRRAETNIDEKTDGAADAGPMIVNPEVELEKKWRSETLRRAIMSLKEEQQLVIYLRFIERRDHTAVAQLLGKSEGAVRTIQFRALQALRRLVDEEVLLGEA